MPNEERPRDTIPAKLQYIVPSSEIRVSQDLSTHAKESISSLESLQKASERAQSHVIVSYEKSAAVWVTWASSLSTLCETMSWCWCTLERVAFLIPITSDYELL
jgi:hypothetical protein